MGWYDFVFDNAYQQDALEEEANVREKYPSLLHEKEQILFAFRDRGGKGRDKQYFTSHRILLKDGKGMGQKRKNYQSVPYSSIQAFAVQTAGKYDGDVELMAWTKGIPYISIDFAAGAVDIYQIQQFMNAQVIAHAGANANNEGTMPSPDAVDPTPPNLDKRQTTAGNIFDWFGDNAMQVDAATVELTFKGELPVLLENETVQVAFKSGRDYHVLTDLRYLSVDVQGAFGKKIEFRTVLWSSVLAFSVQTAGAFLDRDMELVLFTNILNMEEIKQDFRHGKADLFAIQRVLCNHVLGVRDTEETAPILDIDGSLRMDGQVDQKGFWWFRDNQRPIDAVEIDRVYHTPPTAILRSDERVELAFKGRRDVTLFTNYRVVVIDPKGLVGRQIEYTSCPWSSVVGFAVRSPGKFLDFDSEVCFWTECGFFPGRAGDGNDSPPVPPGPLKSYFELDFNKNRVDMSKLNYYLSRRILLLKHAGVGAPIPLDAALTSQSAQPTGVGRLWQWLGGDQRELDPQAIDRELHASGTRVLLDDERVLMAFKAGRDVSLFTDKRVMTLDVQGLSGQKIEYTSISYKSVYAWSVETAGVFDVDTSLNLYTRNRWTLAKVEMDFRTGKADIAQINKFLSALIIGLPTDSKVDFGPKDYSSGNREANPINFGSFGLLDNSWEIDAGTIETKLRTDPALLLDEESVLRAFQSGRDVDVVTNRRLIIIDAKGLSGKRVKYKSIPLRHVKGYEFETAGHLDRDAEFYCYSDIANLVRREFPRSVPCLVTKQSLLVKNIDIYEVGKLFTDHLLFGEEGYAEEPEIDLQY